MNMPTFGPSDTMRGGSRDWTVPAPGVYEIRDEAAPSLRMWVIAEPNVAAMSYPSQKGEFGLNLEEPGEYTVQAYFAGKAIGPATVVKIEQADVELKGPLVLAKATDVKKDNKADADKSDEKPEAENSAEGKDKAAEQRPREVRQLRCF